MLFEFLFWWENMVDVFILFGGFVDGLGGVVICNFYNYVVVFELFLR